MSKGLLHIGAACVIVFTALSAAAVRAQAGSPAADKVLRPISPAHHWQKLDEQGVPFQLNSHFGRQVGELAIEIDSDGVVFGHRLDNVAYIRPGGHLSIRSDNGDGNISLKLVARSDGDIAFDYLIDGYPIDNFAAARHFLKGTLDKVVDKGALSWRVHSLQFLAQSNQWLQRRDIDRQFRIRKMLSQVVNNFDGIYSPQDMALADELSSDEDWLSRGKPIWSASGVAAARTPFNNAFVSSQAKFASLSHSGELAIYTPGDNGEFSYVGIELNNDILLSAYLSATGEPYQVGETEKALAEFWLRAQWQVKSDALQWMAR